MRRSRVVQAVVASIGCAAVLTIGYALGAVSPGGRPEQQPSAPVEFQTIAQASLKRVGLIFVTPTAAQARRVPVSREAAIDAANEQSPGFVTKEAHLAYWRENAGRASEDDHLVWLVVQESLGGYYVHNGPGGTAANTAYIAFVDPQTGAWLGAEAFGR